MPPLSWLTGLIFIFVLLFALPPVTTLQVYTNAIRGAISAIQKLMRQNQPTHMAVILIHQNQLSATNYHHL